MTYYNSSNIVYNPYSAIDASNLSEASLCYQGNPIQDCVNFTPNSHIQQMPAGAFHGQNGSEVRFIHSAIQHGENYQSLDIPQNWPQSTMSQSYGNWSNLPCCAAKGCQSQSPKKKKSKTRPEGFFGCQKWSQQPPIDFNNLPYGCVSNYECPGETTCQSNRCLGVPLTQPVRIDQFSGGARELYKSATCGTGAEGMLEATGSEGMEALAANCEGDPDKLCLAYGLDYATRAPKNINWLNDMTFFAKRCKKECKELKKDGCPRVTQGVPHCICGNGCYGPNVSEEQKPKTEQDFLNELNQQLSLKI